LGCRNFGLGNSVGGGSGPAGTGTPSPRKASLLLANLKKEKHGKLIAVLVDQQKSINKSRNLTIWLAKFPQAHEFRDTVVSQLLSEVASHGLTSS